MDSQKLLVTGGSGFLGERIVARALESGWSVTSLDINPPGEAHSAVEYLLGDVLDTSFTQKALDSVTHVVHAIAHVPLKKRMQNFERVNVEGTRVVLQAAAMSPSHVKTVVVSSSAVYGVPDTNPVGEDTEYHPFEPYGASKANSEFVAREYSAAGLDVSIIRPRTILGAGRLGIFGTLFDWILSSAPVPIVDEGRNIYQFVHVDDLVDAILLALNRSGPLEINVGSTEPLPMREYLQELILQSGASSQLVSINKGLFKKLGTWAGKSRLLPFAPYQMVMFGESMWFDNAKANEVLGWSPRYSSAEALAESFLKYRNRERTADTGGSPHQTMPRPGILRVLKPFAILLNRFIRWSRRS